MITNLSLNANAGLPRMLSVIGSGATCWVQNRFQVFFKWANPGLFFFIFVFSTVNSKYIQYKILPMTGFEPQISGTGSNRSANCATTTAQISFSPSNVKYSERFLCKRRRRNQFYRFIGKIRKWKKCDRKSYPKIVIKRYFLHTKQPVGEVHSKQCGLK